MKWSQKLLTPGQIEALLQYDVGIAGDGGLRRYLAEQSFHAFIDLYFEDEFQHPFAPIHYQMFEDCQEIIDRLRKQERGLRIARLIPRSHAKSTIYARLLPLYCFLFDVSKLTVLLGNNNDAGVRLLDNIRKAIEKNAAIREDFGTMRGERWGREIIESKTGASIFAFGAGAGDLRGVSNPYRPSLIIADDLDDDTSVSSEVELGHKRNWWDKAVSALGDSVTFTTSFVVVGTLIAKTSLLKHIIDKPGFNVIIERGVKVFSKHPELWEQWEKWFIQHGPDGPDQDAFYQGHKQEMLAGTQVLWDRPDAYYEMMLYRLQNGTHAFQSEYQNAPTDSGGRLGDIPLVDTPHDLQNWWLIGVLDPTAKGGKQNDLSAWVEVLFNPQTKKMIVSYVDAKQRSYAETVQNVAHRILNNPMRYYGILVEENSIGAAVISNLAPLIGTHPHYYQIRPIRNIQRKEERIDQLSDPLRLGILSAVRDVDPELKHEIEMWPHSRFDDVIDALACVYLELKRLRMFTFVKAPEVNINRL